MSKIAELFTIDTSNNNINWDELVSSQHCCYLERKCLKIRKSDPDVAIGTCSILQGKSEHPIIICPHRLLERKKVFNDCIHLLTLHEPGNEFHVVAELMIPGGKVDYVLLSTRNGKVKDFVGIELQTLDTSGTIWPERQRFLQSVGIKTQFEDTNKSFGMNWKMTAKTTLVQMHHKVKTFENLNKHLVLVLQDQLLAYMQKIFSFAHITSVRAGDPMHFHAYNLLMNNSHAQLQLSQRLSTDSNGIAACLGLQAEPHIDLSEIISQLEDKISDETLLSFFPIATEQIAPTE